MIGAGNISVQGRRDAFLLQFQQSKIDQFASARLQFPAIWLANSILLFPERAFRSAVKRSSYCC
jgi:hypothetical protein